VRVTQDGRAPRLHEVEVPVAARVDEVRALAARDEEGLAADRTERAHGRVHAAGDPGQRAVEQVSHRDLVWPSRQEALGEVARVVREHEVGTGAFDRGDVLARDGVAIDPPQLRRGLHHRVLAADVVRTDGDVDRVADRP
jgi:hypothetical protein